MRNAIATVMFALVSISTPTFGSELIYETDIYINWENDGFGYISLKQYDDQVDARFGADSDDRLVRSYINSYVLSSDPSRMYISVRMNFLAGVEPSGLLDISQGSYADLGDTSASTSLNIHDYVSRDYIEYPDDYIEVNRVSANGRVIVPMLVDDLDLNTGEWFSYDYDPVTDDFIANRMGASAFLSIVGTLLPMNGGSGVDTGKGLVDKGFATLINDGPGTTIPTPSALITGGAGLFMFAITRRRRKTA